MKKSFELKTVQIVFFALSKTQKQSLLDNSNLNDREKELLTYRLIEGKSLKECANFLGIEEDSVNKAQLKAVKKLYFFLKINQSC